MQLCQDLEAGKEPLANRRDVASLVTLCSTLAEKDAAKGHQPITIWRATESGADKLLALFAVLLRRSFFSASPNNPETCYYATLRHLGLRAFVQTERNGLAIALACVRGDVLAVYNALLAETASQLRDQSQQQPCGSSSSSPSPASISTRTPTTSPQPRPQPAPAAQTKLSVLDRLHFTVMMLVQDALVAVDTTAVLIGSDLLVHAPARASLSAAHRPGELLALQQQQLGVLDRCCRVALELLPLAARHSPVRDTWWDAVTPLFHNINKGINSVATSAATLPCMWLGMVAGPRGPAPPPSGELPLVPDAEAYTAASCAQSSVTSSCDAASSGSSSGGSSSSSNSSSGGGNSGGGAVSTSTATSTSPAASPLPPSSLQCLLAAHVARLCAVLDGGTDHGLAGAGGCGGGRSALEHVPLENAGGKFAPSDKIPQALGVGLAVRALNLWSRARGLWEGSAVRDVWWAAAAHVPDAMAASGTGGGSSSGGSGSGSSNGSGSGDSSCNRQGRGVQSAKAAAADLRRRLAEAEMQVTCSGSSQVVGAAAAAAPTAVAAASGHVADLRRTLAALEVEAAAEQLPPLNRKATAVLCRRLAAAALASMRDAVSHHCIADHAQARVLATEALHCWRLALAPERTCRRRPAPPAAVRQLEGWWRAAVEVLESAALRGMDELLPFAAHLAAAGWPAAEDEQRISRLLCGPCRGEVDRSVPDR